MKRSAVYAITVTAVLAGVLVGRVVAGADKHRPLTEEKKKDLLERFGDQGIDANSDGALTDKEVREFFADKGHRCKKGESKGEAHHPKKAHQKHAWQPAHALHLLDMLESPAMPEKLTAKQLPEADTNGDGQISKEEWNAIVQKRKQETLGYLVKRVSGIDADGDGKLSSEELAAFKTKQLEEFCKETLSKHPDADADGNGALSDAELKAFKAKCSKDRCARILKKAPEADLNEDGKLSDGEMLAFKLKHAPHGPDKKSGSCGVKGEVSHDRKAKHSCAKKGKGS